MSGLVRELTHNIQGEQETRGAEREGKNSVEQRHEEICGRERDGVRYTGQTKWILQGLSERKAGNMKEVSFGWINGGIKRSWFWMGEDKRWW